LVAKRNANGIGIRWEFTIVFLLLAVWTVSLAVPRPKVVFHGGSRWIDENMLVGIPVLCAVAVFAVLIVHGWRTRLQRQRARLEAQIQRAERTNLRRQQDRERRTKIDDLKRQLADAKQQAAASSREVKRQRAEIRKQESERLRQELRAEINTQQQLLREARSRS
jgi:uncharacterized membrane protein YgaE (UPF0421/DUF939 family)